MDSKERKGSFWWEEKAKLALNEDKERRILLEKRKIYLSISMMVWSTVFYGVICITILMYESFRRIPWAKTIEISSILVLITPAWAGSSFIVYIIEHRKSGMYALRTVNWVLWILRKYLSYSASVYSAIYLSMSALLIPRETMDSSLLDTFIRKDPKWTALTPCSVDENLVFFSLGVTTYTFFLVSTEPRAYELTGQISLIICAMIGSAIYKGRQVDGIELLEYDQSNTSMSHDMLESQIGDQLLLKFGLHIYHVVNACFAIAVLVSASKTALSYARTMNNIRTYRKLVEEEEEKINIQLRRMLPETAIYALKSGIYNYAARFSDVTVLFAEIVGLNSTGAPPREIMHYLNKMFREFDALVEKRGVYKVETINTVYVIAAGLPNPQEDHAVLAALVAHDFMNAMSRHMINGQHPQLKVGIHSGAIVAGLIGKEHPRYRLFGDTMNTSARMETTSKPGKIQLSAVTVKKVRKHFEVEKLGKVPVKGKGEMTIWCLGKQKNSSRFKASEILEQDAVSLYRMRSQRLDSTSLSQCFLQSRRRFRILTRAAICSSIFTSVIEDMKEVRGGIRPVDLKAEELTGPLASMNLEQKYESSRPKDREKGSRVFPGIQVDARLEFIKVDSIPKAQDKQQSPRSFLSSAAFVTESANKAAASKYFSRSDFSIRDAEQAFLKKYTHVRASHAANGLAVLICCFVLIYYRLSDCTYIEESFVESLASDQESTRFKVDCRKQFICYNKTWGVALGNIALIIASIAPIAAVAIVLKYCSKKSSRVILGLKWGERTASEENVVVKYTARQYAYFAWLQTNLLALQDLKIRLLLNYTGFLALIIFLMAMWVSGKWQRTETIGFALVGIRCSLHRNIFKIKDAIILMALSTITFVLFSFSDSERFLRTWLVIVVVLNALSTIFEGYLVELATKSGFCELEEARERQVNNNKLLDSMIPPRIQKIMIASPTKGLAVQLSNCCVLLADIEGFTSFSAQLPPEVLVTLLNQLFSAFDAACKYFDVTKIETIGDAYLAATGCLPSANAIRRTKSSKNKEPVRVAPEPNRKQEGSIIHRIWKSLLRRANVRPDTIPGSLEYDKHAQSHRIQAVSPSRRSQRDDSKPLATNAQGSDLKSKLNMSGRGLIGINTSGFSSVSQEASGDYRAIFRPESSLNKSASSEHHGDDLSTSIPESQTSFNSSLKSRKQDIDLVTENYKRMMQDIKKQEDCDKLAGFALEMHKIIKLIDVPESVQLPDGRKHLRLRIGLHRGPTIGGIVGTKMLRYHLFGETVDVAAKCEQSCVPGRVHVTDNFAQLLSGSYECEEHLEDLNGHKTFLIKEQ